MQNYSLFDIIGPRMVGPSSSHTAGAAKLGHMARKIARGDVKEKLKKAIKDGLSEDNEKDAEAELQKIHDKYIKRVDDLLALKTKEIMTV